MEKLPKNWVSTELRSVARIVTGNTPKKSENKYYGKDFLWVKPGDLNEKTYIEDTEEKLSKLGFEASRLVPKESVLVTCIGNLGRVGIASEDLATNQQINSIVIEHNLINKKFMYYSSLILKKWLVENSTSTTISMVNKSNFEMAPFLFPPLPEQERIVAKLDALFAQHVAMKKALECIPQLLKDFRQQILNHAVTGKLTKEWREGKDLEKWFFEKSSKCCEKVQSGGTPKGSKFSENGIPFLKVYNIVNNKIDFHYNPQWVSEEIHNSQLKKSIGYSGDVIMNIVGPPLNKIAILTDEFQEWNLNQAITIFRAKIIY